jgi:hypothetical protein
MRILIALAEVALTSFAASDASVVGIAMHRVLSCDSPDAKMDAHLPDAVPIGIGNSDVRIADHSPDRASSAFTLAQGPIA